MALERLQKALARAGVASRRKIEELVARRRVTINGEIAQLGDKVDLEVDSVKVDGKRIQPLRRPHLYLVLNKPPGYVSTVNDPENRPTVLNLLPLRLHKALFPVGRLDYDSEGLLLLTTDGEFAQKVAHPSSGCTKIYEVKVKGHPEGPAIAKLLKGIVLDGRRAAPVWVEPFGGPPGRRTGRDNSWYRVALKEGRTRQIREMFFRIGHPVMRLKRTQIGGFTDPLLRLGHWRELEPLEIETLISNIEPARRQERSRARPKVKFEKRLEGWAKPAHLRAAPAATGAAGAAGTSEKETAAAVPAKKAVRRRIVRPEGEAAGPAERKAGTRARVTPRLAGKALPRMAERRSPRDEDDSEWTSTSPAKARKMAKVPREEEDWAAPAPVRERPLFEESEYEPNRPSLLYGDDDENWDEPLVGGPARPAAPGGRPGRPGRPGASGPGARPGGRAGGGRPGAGRPGGGRPGRPGAGRPGEGRSADGRSEWRAEEGRPRAGRPAAGRPSAGRPSAGRPEGGRPEGGRPAAGRPSAGRPSAGRPSAGRPSAGRPGGEGRPAGGRPSGRPGGRPGGGGRSGSGKPRGGKG